jgi:hypothetical protein
MYSVPSTAIAVVPMSMLTARQNASNLLIFCFAMISFSFQIRKQNRNTGGRAVMAFALDPLALRPALSSGLPLSLFHALSERGIASSFCDF